MAESYAIQLDRVQTAIAAIERGTVSAYTVGNQSFTKHDLGVLYRREERLLRKIAKGNDKGTRVAHV